MTDTEIRVKFQRIEDTLERQDDSLKRIEAMGRDTNVKVGYTNGKVGELVKWRERATGAGWAFGVFATLVIVPLAGWLLYNQSQEPDRMQAAMSNYFNDNYSSIKVNNNE